MTGQWPLMARAGRPADLALAEVRRQGRLHYKLNLCRATCWI
jgi:hypothetical protein